MRATHARSSTEQIRINLDKGLGCLMEVTSWHIPTLTGVTLPMIRSGKDPSDPARGSPRLSGSDDLEFGVATKEMLDDA